MQSVFLPVITTEGGTLMTKRYEELTFADDFMFCRVLEDSPGLCRELLSLILDRPVGELVSVNRQKPIEIKADSKGVRFDIYAEGDDSTIYNVEMQNASVDNIAKRARYAQGMLDLNLLDRGAKYKDLNRSYVIYICQFNINETAGLHKYSFANLCREDTSIDLGDEAEKIFLCAKGTADDISDQLRSFLNYVATGAPSDQFTNKLENAVKKARDHIQWRQDYMTFLEQLEKAEEKGIEKGREEERANTERERQRADAAEAIIEALRNESPALDAMINELLRKAQEQNNS